MPATTAPMSLRIERSARMRLQKIAQIHKRTPHALATEAIYAMIDKKERENVLNQSCMDSYNHFQETGLHATEKEVTDWMDSWGTDNELPPPVCHA